MAVKRPTEVNKITEVKCYNTIKFFLLLLFAKHSHAH